MKEKQGNGAVPRKQNNGSAREQNGAARGAKKVAPPVQGKVTTEVRLRMRPKRLSAKELARRAELKAYFDSLDEDAQIREFEKLSLDDKHWLAWAYTYEEAQQGKRLT